MEKSNIYIGEIIKNVMLEQQVTKAELARRLKVKPQSVDYMLTRKSIDTDTLYNVSRALNYDFALLYSIHKEQINYDTLEQEYRQQSENRSDALKNGRVCRAERARHERCDLFSRNLSQSELQHLPPPRHEVQI